MADDQHMSGEAEPAPRPSQTQGGGLLPPDGASRQQSSALRILLGGASVFVIIFGLKFAREVVNPVLFAFVITLAISPLLHWLVRRGLSTAWAFVITLIVACIVGVVFVVIMAASVAQLAHQLPSYADKFNQMKDDAVRWLNDLGIDTGQLASKNFSGNDIVNFALGLTDNLMAALKSVWTIGLVFLFMLWDAAVSSSKYSYAMQPEPLFARMDRFTHEVRGFLKIQVLLGALAAIIETALLLALGVDFALLWGIVSFLFSFIPYVGFIAALIPPTILGLFGGGWVTALIVIIGYVVINTLTDNLLKPSIMGKETNLSPLVVFLSLVVWGWTLGGVGALLSVPLTLMARTLFLEGYQESQWLAKLMAKTEKPKSAGAVGKSSRRHGHRRRKKAEDAAPAEEAPEPQA